MKNYLMLYLCITFFAIPKLRAQNYTYTKSAMVVLVSEAKRAFVKGATFDQWKLAQVGSTAVTENENVFLKDVYKFLSGGQDPQSVFNQYDGVSLLTLLKSNSMTGLAASNAKCGFWCQLINAIFAPVRNYYFEIPYP